MPHGSKYIAVAKVDIDKFMRRPRLSKFAIRKRLHALEKCACQFEELVPWPALRESMFEDVVSLRAILDRVGD